MGKLIVGKNDLATLHPELAAEADGWDPSTIHSGTNQRMNWKCELGHTWGTSPSHRTLNKSGCPFCSNSKVWAGFNDLKTTFPDLAKEAEGWDPRTILAGSDKKMNWKCSKGHTWQASPNGRTGKGKNGCPYCANKKVWAGFNDLKTLFPEIAKDAFGWDPSTLTGGSKKRVKWECKIGHKWDATVCDRTGSKKSGCPYCSHKKLLVGFNDLRTTAPEIAKEAFGWDPSKMIAGTKKKMLWKCKTCGFKWNAVIKERTGRDKTGCPVCVEYGFNPEKTAWFYLMERENEQQFGITNNLESRMREHSRFGWVKVDATDAHNGKDIQEIESKFKKWLRQNIGLVPDKQENWYKSKMEVSSLAELKEKSGIETSLF